MRYLAWGVLVACALVALLGLVIAVWLLGQPVEVPK